MMGDQADHEAFSSCMPLFAGVQETDFKKYAVSEKKDSSKNSAMSPVNFWEISTLKFRTFTR